MTKPKGTVDDSPAEEEDDLFEAEDDDRPVLYELHIKHPKKAGKGKGRLVPWWNRISQYKTKRQGKLRRQKKKEGARSDA